MHTDVTSSTSEATFVPLAEDAGTGTGITGAIGNPVPVNDMEGNIKKE